MPRICYSTISTHHGILTRMAGGYGGSIDAALQWINRLPASPGADFVFQSTAYNDTALHGDRSVYAITLGGGTSFAGGAYEKMRMQRPALMI